MFPNDGTIGSDLDIVFIEHVLQRLKIKIAMSLNPAALSRDNFLNGSIVAICHVVSQKLREEIEWVDPTKGVAAQLEVQMGARAVA